jgi:hypothetical protein
VRTREHQSELRYANLARSRGTYQVKARCNGRCAGCSCGRDSAARLGYRARRSAVLAGIVHELFDLASGQVFPNCTVYSHWWAGIPSLIPHGKSRLVAGDWKANTPILYSANKLRLACSAQCHPMTPPDVCSRPVLRRRSASIAAPATSRNGARRLILIAGPVVDVTGATGVETTANGVETSLPSAIPGHARMLHLALAPTRLTLDQSVRLLGRCRLPSIQLVRLPA